MILIERKDRFDLSVYSEWGPILRNYNWFDFTFIQVKADDCDIYFEFTVGLMGFVFMFNFWKRNG